MYCLISKLVALIKSNLVASVALITAIAAFSNAGTAKKQLNNVSSSRALKEFKECFSEAIKLIEDGNNDFLNWHGAYFFLIECEKLMPNIRETNKNALSAYYLNFSIHMRKIISKPNKSTFFYGLPDWEDLSDEEAHKQACPKIQTSHLSLDEKTGKTNATHSFQKPYRISPERLRFLIRFIDIDRGAVNNITHGESFDINQIVNNPASDKKFSGDELVQYSKYFKAAYDYIEDIERRSR